MVEPGVWLWARRPSIGAMIVSVNSQLPELSRLERGILGVISLCVGLGMAYVVKTLVWRTPVGPGWVKGLVVGSVGFGVYLAVDWWLFRSARENLRSSVVRSDSQD